MANKPLKSITFPGLTDTYTIPQIDTSLTVEGKAADAQAVGNKFTEVSATAGKAFPTDTASGSVASFADGADDIPMKSVKVAIELVQSGSGDPSPDNIRPISGWTEANVVRTGINIWDEEWENGTYNMMTGIFIYNASYFANKNPVHVKPNTVYYLGSSVNATWEMCFYDENMNFLSTSSVTNATFRTPNNCHFVNFNGATTFYGTTYNHDISINYPSTDHDYHPFTGNDTYSITFPSEAGTVYGGELDVTNGVLTVDRAMVDLGTLTWNLRASVDYGEYFWGDVHALGIKYEGNYYQTYYNALCSQYSVANRTQALQTDKMLCFDGSVGEVWQIQMKDSDYSDATAFKTAMSGVQLCYQLATPITYHLTPTEIKSLLGDNNIWADAGDTEVTYRADTAMYIDKKIAEVVNALS